ncbi:MAG: efflux RND transporter periplasmic adaptor subunit [Anaerolineae bacterium]|nr:efflux RND transporter periplasmic adaptor subunit [Anaerolineae bacterium]
MTKRKWFWIISILVVLLVTAVGYAYYANNTAVAAADSEETDVQTAVARLGEIVVSATGAGAVIPATEVELSFTTGGVLEELLVTVGQKVQAGDVLAQVDDTDAQKALANAELSLAQAAMQTDASTTQTGVSYDDISVEQARLNLEEAQQALADLQNWTADPDEIALLQTRLEAAEASYNGARGQEAATSTNITIKNISVEQAQRDLDAALAAQVTAYDPGREWELNDPRRSDALLNERERADDAVLRAQENLQIAQLNYNAAVNSTNSSSSVSAESNLLSAQQELAAAQVGATAQEIAAAETAVRQAELSLQQAQLNQEAHGLSLAQAQLNLESAQADVDGTVLVAPMDGTVTAVNYHVGEQVGTAVFLTLADLAQPMLEIYLDETDLDKAGVGFAVDVVFDALPDETFTGEIVQVDPALYQSNGVSAVRAVVRLNYNKPQTLPVGLNATVEVIGGRAQNAVVVPVEALREISPDQYAVFVMENGEPTLRMVEVGLMDFSFAEILSGVEAGEEVTTGIVETE